MKRNIVPLLGIAFVVAIISTGVFYGLFAGKLHSSPAELANRTLVVAARELDRGKVLASSDLRVGYIRGSLSGSFSKPEELVGATVLASLKENEPLLEGRVVLTGSGSRGSARGVPAGMRALSIRIAESDGVASLLSPGARIDIQAVSDRNGNGNTELRTILQNVEVLSVAPPVEANGGNRNSPRIVAVLTDANDADVVALADAASRIRVALRNPLDEATTAHRSLALPSVFRPTAERAALENTPEAREKTPPALDNAPQARLNNQHPIQLRVEVLAASPVALAELNSKLVSQRSDDQLRVSAFQAGASASALVETLKQKQELEIVSSKTLSTAVGEPISYRASAAQYRLRLRFLPENGDAKLRVTPELSVPSGGGVETRQYDAQLEQGASFLVEGLASGGSGRAVLERLFPKHSWNNRELVIFVDAEGHGPGAVAALSRSARGR